jgi:hypothetical protein
MATPVLNVELLQYFTPVFTFIFVFAVIYALLQYAKLLGDNKVLHAAISFVVAVFAALVSSAARQMIEYMVPWFTVFIIFTVLVIVMYKIFGASDDDIRTVIKKHSGIQWTIAIICIIIALGALSNSFGQSALTGNSGTTGTGSTSTDTETGTSGDTTTDSGSTVTGTGTSTTSFQTNLNRAFYHPKVLGMIFLLLVAAFAVALLSRPVTKSWP